MHTVALRPFDAERNREPRSLSPSKVRRKESASPGCRTRRSFDLGQQYVQFVIHERGSDVDGGPWIKGACLGGTEQYVGEAGGEIERDQCRPKAAWCPVETDT